MNHDELKSWVQKELDGYSADDTLPDYRVKPCHSKGHFVGFAGMQLKNAPIPTQNLPDEIEKLMITARLRESVSALQNLAQTGDKDEFGTPWPPLVIELYASSFYQDMVLIQATQVVPRDAIVSIIETVRNRVLNFSLEIEAANPLAGEAAAGSTPVPKGVVSQIFNNYISGNVGNIASGSSSFQQSAIMTVKSGDAESLRHELEALGLSAQDSKDLTKAIQADPPLTGKKPFGPKVSTWLGNALAKSARGALKVSTEVAAETLSRVIKGYCGVP